MTIITQSDSGGTRRCDGTCHSAKTSKCMCICGGRYHGAGNRAQEMLTRDWFGDDWREKLPTLAKLGGKVDIVPDTTLARVLDREQPNLFPGEIVT